MDTMQDQRLHIVKEPSKRQNLNQLDQVHVKQLQNENRRLFLHTLEFEEPAEEYFWDDYDLGFYYDELDYEDDLLSVHLSTSPSTANLDAGGSKLHGTSSSIQDLHEMLKMETDTNRLQKQPQSTLASRIIKSLRMRVSEWKKKNKKSKVTIMTDEKKQKTKGQVLSRASRWIREKLSRKRNSVPIEKC